MAAAPAKIVTTGEGREHDIQAILRLRVINKASGFQMTDEGGKRVSCYAAKLEIGAACYIDKTIAKLRGRLGNLAGLVLCELAKGWFDANNQAIA